MRLITRFSLLRSITIGILKLFPRKKIETNSNLSLGLDEKKVLNTINNLGFSDTFKIDELIIQDIIAYSNTALFDGINGHGQYKVDYHSPVNPGDQLWYTNPRALECEQVKNIGLNEQVISIARKYLGVEPKIKDARMWWSFPQSNQKEYNHLYGFHYDIDDYKFLKLFVYITDVNMDGGPHSIIERTHKSKNLFEKKNRRLTDQLALKTYGEDRIRVMIGNKGTSFFEDTFSYHKGTSPSYPRLLLQFEYSIS